AAAHLGVELHAVRLLGRRFAKGGNSVLGRVDAGTPVREQEHRVVLARPPASHGRLAKQHEFLHVQRMRLGTGEIIVILFVILVVFSASRMAALGNALGKFFYSFKKAAKGQDFIDVKRIPDRAKAGTGKPPEDAAIVEEEK